MLWDDTETNANLKLKWLVQDHLGSTRMEIGIDGAATAVTRHDYLPFGEELAGSMRSAANGYSVTKTRQKFTSKQRDDETGLDFFEARHYSSVQGRFTTPDEFNGGPVEVFSQATSTNPTFYADLTNPQSLNKYQYSYNNPLRYTDPDGHTPCCDVAGSVNDFVQGAQGLDPRLAKAAAIAGAAILGTAAIYENTSWEDVKAGAKRFLRGSDDGIQCFDGGCSPAIMNKAAAPNSTTQQGEQKTQSQANQNTQEGSKTKGSKTRSPDPPGARKRYNTKKEAEQAARKAGDNRKPVNHPDDPHGPHFHPSNEKGKPLNHDHYFYPKNRR